MQQTVLHGIEVFKKAEVEAAQAQDEVRHEKRIKTTSQTAFLFGGAPPQSAKVSHLYEHHNNRARRKIIEILADSKEGLPYAKIFGEAMAFPLVTPGDLQNWISDLEDKGALRTCWDGAKRRVRSWKRNDYIVVSDKLLLS